MGSFLAKQPNGLYCRFSSVVDCPTQWNMTQEAYVKYCKERAEEYANTVFKLGSVQPFSRVAELFRDINMTKEEFERFLKDVEKPATEVTKTVEYKYEVNIGGGCATGSVHVSETATDDEIRLAIMDDLYDVDYEKVEEEI